MKSWKDLFVKTDDEAEAPSKEIPRKEPATESFSFPTTSSAPVPQQATVTPSYTPQPATDPVVAEVMKMYENGLDSINMPGYDFYEFYQSVIGTGTPAEQTYNMAYQMGRTLDKTITPAKLLTDAEFYISKINEVHSQYVSQGQMRLASLQEKKGAERTSLQAEVDGISGRIAQLRAELHQLETDVTLRRNALGKVDEGYAPQEKTIREKLTANDIARKTSIDKLNMIKEGIQRFIK